MELPETWSWDDVDLMDQTHRTMIRLAAGGEGEMTIEVETECRCIF